MSARSRNATTIKRLDDNALGLRESEITHADTFEAEFPVITGRTVEIIPSEGDPPDRVALIDGVETGSS